MRRLTEQEKENFRKNNPLIQRRQSGGKEAYKTREEKKEVGGEIDNLIDKVAVLKKLKKQVKKQ